MASMLFSTIGQAVGGPLGGALGALLGGTIDRSLFGARRAPPRDLFVQRSAYGETIPRVFGRARQAGILIWAQPVQRNRSGGKGSDSARRGTTASFALAISSGPIRRIGRIWADGREFRSADGRFAGPVTMRVHPGLDGQPPDPLIVAAEGAGRAPAYRGLAYVVFENLALAEFGNRLPNLSFEVFADEETPSHWLGALMESAECTVRPLLSDGTVGFVADQPRWRDNAELLASWIGADPAYPDGQLTLGGEPREILIPAADLGAVPAPEQEPATPERAIAMERRPGAWSVGYYDPERDYQRGLQTEWRPRVGRELGLDAPVIASAAAAREVAALRMRRAEAGAETLQIALPMRWIFLAVGDVVRVEGVAGRWRVVRQTTEALIVTIVCEALPPAGARTPPAADPGRSLPSPVQPAPATLLRAVEPPVDPWAPTSRPGLLVAGSGAAGWAGATILFSSGAGAEPVEIGSIAPGLWAGTLLEPLPAGPGDIWDERNQPLVEVLEDENAPLSTTAEAVLAGGNLLLVGGELLQFREAIHAGGRSYRLRGLLRGRGATVIPPGGHPAGTQVIRLDPSRIARRPVTVDEERLAVTLHAEGRGDPPGGTTLELSLTAAGHAPLAPCHLQARLLPDGDLHFSWISRSRQSFGWGSEEAGMPQPYECRIGGPAAVSRQVSGHALVWPVADQIAETGAPVRAGTLQVIAIGAGPEAVRASPPLAFAF